MRLHIKLGSKVRGMAAVVAGGFATGLSEKNCS